MCYTQRCQIKFTIFLYIFPFPPSFSKYFCGHNSKKWISLRDQLPFLWCCGARYSETIMIREWWENGREGEKGASAGDIGISEDSDTWLLLPRKTESIRLDWLQH